MKQCIEYLPCGHEGYLVEQSFLIAKPFYYCNDCGKLYAVELRQVEESDKLFRDTTKGIFSKLKELGRMSYIRCNIGMKQAKELGLFENLK